MMKRRLTGAAAAACMAIVLGFAGPAAAGEWAPGKPGSDGKLTPIKTNGVASSECAFSGRDEPDLNNDGSEPPGPDGYDDGLWLSTPAKGNVQSPGQLVAAGYLPPGTPGQACRGGGSAGN